MKTFAEQHGFGFPYLVDPTQGTAAAYGAVCTPDFFGFNKDLELQYRGRLDESRTALVPDARRELFEAMRRSEEHTSELQSLMRISYAVFCLKKQTYNITPLRLATATHDAGTLTDPIA